MADNTSPPDERASRPVEPLVLFEILARENADSLISFLRASVTESAADDLFQETMLVAWRKINEYDRSRPFGAWLRGIAKRIVLAHFRKAGRGVAMSDELLLDHLDQRMAQIDHQPGDTLDEKITALRDCIEHLAPLYREPIALHYQHHRTTEWIANHLSTTKDAVQKQLQRARIQLAECLERKDVLARME